MAASDNLASKQFKSKWPIHVSVPTKFFKDHVSRCDAKDACGGNPIKVVKPGAKLTTVELHESQHKDLLSDADYYDYDKWSKQDEPEAHGLAPSARATKSALLKATSPTK